MLGKISGVPIAGPTGGVREKNNQVKGKKMGKMGKPNSTRPGGITPGIIILKTSLSFSNT